MPHVQNGSHLPASFRVRQLLRTKVCVFRGKKKSVFGRLLHENESLERTDEGIHGFYTDTEEMLTSESELQVLTG